MSRNTCAELCWVRTVRCERNIRRSAAEIFDIISHPVNDSRWMLGLVGTDVLTPGGMREGTRMTCKFGIGPLTVMKAEAVIDEFESGRRFVRRRVGGKLAMKGEFLVEPAGDASHITWTMEVGLAVPLLDFLLNPLVSQWLKLSMAYSLRNLQRLAEGSHFSMATVNERVSHAA